MGRKARAPALTAPRRARAGALAFREIRCLQRAANESGVNESGVWRSESGANTREIRQRGAPKARSAGAMRADCAQPLCGGQFGNPRISLRMRVGLGNSLCRWTGRKPPRMLADAPSRRRDVQVIMRRIGERTGLAGRLVTPQPQPLSHCDVMKRGEGRKTMSGAAIGRRVDASIDLHWPEPASGGNV
jgi:hypothetical protein